MKNPSFFIVEGEKIICTKNGKWFSNGTEITHSKTKEAFYKNTEFDENKSQYYIQIGYERIYIETEDTPYFVTDVFEKNNKCFARISNDKEIEILESNLQYSDEPDNRALYLQIDKFRKARFLSAPYYEFTKNIDIKERGYNVHYGSQSFFISLCLFILFSFNADARKVTKEERLEILQRARVWENIDPSKQDTFLGPQDNESYTFKQIIQCTYIENDPNDPITGYNKKFRCRDEHGKKLKIKYDPIYNTEVYSEVAATRLFWGLGFYSEKMYSVITHCANCPKDPFTSNLPPRGLITFDPSTIQNKLKGEKIWVDSENDGWSWSELALIDSTKGGSTKAEIDAFILLNVFLNGGDNTSNQNYLLCPEGDIDCKKPILYIHDLGGTFGGKGFYAKYINWKKEAKIWKNPEKCITAFKGNDDQFVYPIISEAGRALFSDLISKLSENQIYGIFNSARFDVFNYYDEPIIGENGELRKITVDDWVKLFYFKAKQITENRCSS